MPLVTSGCNRLDVADSVEVWLLYSDRLFAVSQCFLNLLIGCNPARAIVGSGVNSVRASYQ